MKFRIDETIFAAYDKAEMRRAKILVIASSDLHTFKSLFWHDMKNVGGNRSGLDAIPKMAIGNQRQTEMNPITFVFAGINDHLHSRDLLSRLREPTTGEDAVWPAVKDILESMGEIIDVLKESILQKTTSKPVFVLSPGYAYLSDGLKFVYAMIALLLEWNYDVIIPPPNRKVEARNLRPLRSELPAVWSYISNAMGVIKHHSLHMLVTDEVLRLELSNFSRQLKLTSGIDDYRRMIVGMSNDLWLWRSRKKKKRGRSPKKRNLTRKL